MPPERRRAGRYACVANIELTDVESEDKMREQTCDLSLFGCQVRAANPWAVGRKVHLKIFHRGKSFIANGRVAHVQDSNMGVEFTNVADKDSIVLEEWVAELREKVGDAHRAEV